MDSDSRSRSRMSWMMSMLDETSDRGTSSARKSLSSSLSSSSSSLDAATAMRKIIRSLETKLEDETNRRKTLEVTYSQLVELRTKQSSQLELITSSRDSYREETMKLKATIESERKDHAETVAAFQSAADAMIPVIEESQGTNEIKRLKEVIQGLETKIRKKDDRVATSESLIKSLTKEVETLNADLKQCCQKYESKIEATNETHTKEILSLQESTKSELEQQRNESKEKNRIVSEQLKDMEKNLNELEEQSESQKGRISELEDSLNDANEELKESEQAIDMITAEMNQLQNQVKDDRAIRVEAEEEIQKLIEELDATKCQISDKVEDRIVDTQDQNRENLESVVASLRKKVKRNQQIELQNEELVNHAADLEEQLEVAQSDLEDRDEVLRQVQLELEDARIQLCKQTQVETSIESDEEEDINKDEEEDEEAGSFTKDIRNESIATKLNADMLKEKQIMDESQILNEEVRHSESDLEVEIDDKIYEDHLEVIDVDKKRDNESDSEESPRKKAKTREGNTNYNCNKKDDETDDDDDDEEEEEEEDEDGDEEEDDDDNDNDNDNDDDDDIIVL